MKRMINITPGRNQYTFEYINPLITEENDTDHDTINNRIFRLSIFSLIWTSFLLPILYLSMNNDTAYSIMKVIFTVPCILVLLYIVYTLGVTLIKDIIALLKMKKNN